MFWIHSLIVLVGWALCGAAFAQDMRVKFPLDWVIDGQQTPFLLTQGKGYFTQQGVNVTLDAGTGSAAAVQRVATGTYHMGCGDTSALIEHLSRSLGEASKARLQRQVEDVGSAFGLDRLPETDQIFIPAFLPPRAERML